VLDAGYCDERRSVVCVSVCVGYTSQPRKVDWTDRNAAGTDSRWPNECNDGCSGAPRRHMANTMNWSVQRQRCNLLFFRTTGWAKKWGQKFMAIILSSINRFTKFFFTERFLREFAVNWWLKIPPHLAYVATLPCETLMSKNKRLTINYTVV